MNYNMKYTISKPYTGKRTLEITQDLRNKIKELEMMRYKYSIINCTKKEGLYRAVIHLGGEKYSKDYSVKDYGYNYKEACEMIAEDFFREVSKMIPKILKLERV